MRSFYELYSDIKNLPQSGENLANEICFRYNFYRLKIKNTYNLMEKLNYKYFFRYSIFLIVMIR